MVTERVAPRRSLRRRGTNARGTSAFNSARRSQTSVKKRFVKVCERLALEPLGGVSVADCEGGGRKHFYGASFCPDSKRAPRDIQLLNVVVASLKRRTLRACESELGSPASVLRRRGIDVFQRELQRVS